MRHLGEQGGRLALALNASDGSISSLRDVASGHEWVGGAHFMGFVYRTYAEADFDVFNADGTRAGSNAERVSDLRAALSVGQFLEEANLAEIHKTKSVMLK